MFASPVVIFLVVLFAFGTSECQWKPQQQQLLLLLVLLQQTKTNQLTKYITKNNN